MDWVTISTDKLRARLSDTEYTAVETKGLADDQTDPWAVLIGDAIDAARGAIAGNPHNVLGQEGTVPRAAVRHILAQVVWDGLSRLLLKSSMTDAREKSFDAANKFFDGVAARKIGIEKPTNPISNQIPNRVGNVQQVDTEQSPKRRYTREKMDGI